MDNLTFSGTSKTNPNYFAAEIRSLQTCSADFDLPDDVVKRLNEAHRLARSINVQDRFTPDFFRGLCSETSTSRPNDREGADIETSIENLTQYGFDDLADAFSKYYELAKATPADFFDDGGAFGGLTPAVVRRIETRIAPVRARAERIAKTQSFATQFDRVAQQLGFVFVADEDFAHHWVSVLQKTETYAQRVDQAAATNGSSREMPFDQRTADALQSVDLKWFFTVLEFPKTGITNPTKAIGHTNRGLVLVDAGTAGSSHVSVGSWPGRTHLYKIKKPPLASQDPIATMIQPVHEFGHIKKKFGGTGLAGFVFFMRPRMVFATGYVAGAKGGFWTHAPVLLVLCLVGLFVGFMSAATAIPFVPYLLDPSKPDRGFGLALAGALAILAVLGITFGTWRLIYFLGLSKGGWNRWRGTFSIN